MAGSGHDASSGSARGQRAARRATRDAQQPSTTTGSVQSVVASLGRLGATAQRDHEYAKTGVDTGCEIYVSLGANQCGFEDWYDTKFVHRVLDPKIAEGEKKRRTRRNTLILNAMTSARGTTAAPAEPVPDGAAGPEGAPARVVAPEIQAVIDDIAAEELFNTQEQFELLLKYVSDEADMKESILKVIADNDQQQFNTGKQKMDYFREEMAKATAPTALHKAMWAGIQRNGLLEQPKAYATRFKVAAQHCGRTTIDINLAFMKTVTAPWTNDPQLREKLSTLESEHRKNLQDNVNLHIDEIAEDVTEEEALAVTKTVNELEHEGTLMPTSNDGASSSSPSATSRATSSAPPHVTSQSLAELLGLPWKQTKGGWYRACGDCFVRDEVVEWHSPKACRHHRGGAADAKAKPPRGKNKQPDGQAMAAQQQFVCFKCGKPGHRSTECTAGAQTEAGTQAYNEWRAAKNGKAMVASSGDQPDQPDLNSLIQLVQAQGKQLSELTMDLTGKQPSGTMFMAQAAEAAWLPSNPSDGGFCFNDCYSSDDSGTGLLGSFVVRPGCGTPLGMVPAVYVGTRARANPPCNTQPSAPAAAATPVPQSARRQQRMRLPEHDEARAMRNRLPAGMINPADLAPQIAPAAAHESLGEQPSMANRVAALVWMLRTALQHTQFGALPTTLVSDTSPESAAAWQRAKSAALSGMDHDGQDPRSVAWTTALHKAVNRWQAQAALTFADYCQLDLRAVFREAILATFGSDAARIAMDPAAMGIELPASDGLYGAEVCSITARVPLPPMRADNVEPPVGEHAMPQPANVATATVAAAAVATDIDDPLELHRQRRKAWRQTIRWPHRRPVATVKGADLPVTVNGHRITGHIVLDIGANEPMIHQRLVDKLKYAVNPNGRRITGIHGASHMMPRTIEPLEVTLFPNDCDREAQASDTMMVMNGDSLPELLLDNEMLAQLDIVVNTVDMTASYRAKPYDESDTERIQITLMRPEEAYGQLATGASGSTAVWPASFEANTQFNGLCCVANSHLDLGVGGGNGTPIFAASASLEGDGDSETDGDEGVTDPEDGVVAGRHLLQMLQQQPASVQIAQIATTAEEEQENAFPMSMTYHQVYIGALRPALSEHDDDFADGGAIFSGKSSAAKQYSQADLDRIPALPHTDPNRLFVLDMEAVQGRRYGGMSALYLCAGVLTSLVSDVTEGVHFRIVRILERNPQRRHQAEKVIRRLHQQFPERLPAKAIKSAFTWADAFDHDGSQLDGSLLAEELGLDNEIIVHIEAPCQGHSALGPRNGFQHAESGVLVPIAAALADLQYILARKRGIKDWESAAAQFGYVMENVPGPYKDEQHTDETRRATAFMDRVFGPHRLHDPATCGDLASRHAKWWSNMFTTDFYEAHEPLFRQGPYMKLADMVEQLTDGKLQPQIVTTRKQLQGGLNKMGERAAVLPKFVSRPLTVNQRLTADGKPGAGMLEVVGSDPPQYAACPAAVRIKAQRFWPPHMECLGALEETEMIRIVGNVCAPTSCKVMLRMALGYAAWVRRCAEMPSPPVSDQQTEDSAAAMERAIARAAAEELSTVATLEMEYAVTGRPEEPPEHNVAVPKPKTVSAALTAAAQAKAKTDARVRHSKAQRAADARRKAARVMHDAKARTSGKRSKSKDRQPHNSRSIGSNILRAVMMLLMIAGMWGPAAYSAGRSAGIRDAADVAAGYYAPGSLLVDVPPSAAWMSDSRLAYDWDPGESCCAQRQQLYQEATAPGQCLYELANPTATGQPEEGCKVPSTLVSAKDQTQHQWNIGSNFRHKQKFAAMMDTNPDWYAWGLTDLREVKDAEYRITLSDPKPIFAKQYHLAHRESEFAENWAKELEAAGLVREVESPYAAPVVVAPKKNEEGHWTDLRYAIDYRRLNAVTVRDQYPTPVPEEILARMNGASLYSTMDCQKAFHQVPVSTETQPLLAFHSGTRLLTWRRMPFGGKNSVACWQRIVDEALQGLEFAQAFADDVVIWSTDDEEEHMRRVRVVLERLHAKGVQISPKKCKLGMQRLEFLGHIVSADGVEPMWDKVEAITKLPRPTNPSEVRSFIGMATYYCKFLDHYSHVKRPLTELTKKDVKWTWGEAEEEAFRQIKEMLVSAPVLRNPDWNRPFILHTDWSKAGVGACLSQIADDGQEYAVAFASRMNSRAESTFSSYEGEVSAVVYAAQRFRYYLWGKPFKLITDCKAMQWLTSTAKLRSKIARWSLILAEYDFEIVHRPGKDNTVPDLLSRQPIEGATSGGRPVGLAFHLARRSALQQSAWSYLSNQWAAPVVAGYADGQALVASGSRFDPWADPEAVQFVRGELARGSVSSAKWSELQRKCSRFQLRDGRIWLRAGNGRLLEIPPPAQRTSVVLRVHEENGHLGRDRTHAMVSQRYTWPGMWKTVADTLKTCSQCDRVRVSFDKKFDTLQPLPLMGLFYRFHLDAAVSLPIANTGECHVLIIVEAFSKWIDLVPLPELTAAACAAAFRERVLARFGRPVEVTTDNGAEYRAEFHQLCTDNGIDHRTITAGHPESNGLAERLVQVMKKALRKYVLQHGTADWPSQLPTIEFGYRTSPQRSTGYSPYFLIYGREPTYPAQVRALLDGQAVDVEDLDAMYELITQRARALRDAMPVAYERASIAQFKQGVRFRKVRQSDLPPRRHRFGVGDYVYVSQRPVNTLDVKTTRTILRVRAIRPHGVLELEGADGRTIRVRMELCAPCHIPNLVTDAVGVPADLACTVCGSPSMADPMLLCDRCDRGYHLHCLQPPLEHVPVGTWCCPQCQLIP